jgi:hypothetical protein
MNPSPRSLPASLLRGVLPMTTPDSPTLKPSRGGGHASTKKIIAIAAVLAIAIALWPTLRGAQAQSAQRARGNYLILAGKNISNDTSQLFCLDSSNQELIALRWNPSAGQLEVSGYRSLVNDRQNPIGPAGRGGR